MTRTKLWGLCIGLVLMSACGSSSETRTYEERFSQAMSDMQRWGMEHGAGEKPWWEGLNNNVLREQIFTYELQSLLKGSVRGTEDLKLLPALTLQDISLEEDQYLFHFASSIETNEYMTARDMPFFHVVLHCDQSHVDYVLSLQTEGDYSMLDYFDVVVLVDSVVAEDNQRKDYYFESPKVPAVYGVCRALRISPEW